MSDEWKALNSSLITRHSSLLFLFRAADGRVRACGRALLALEGSALASGIGRALLAVFGVLPEPTEDHLAGGRLQNARHSDVGVLANHAPRVVNDDHRAIVEIRDALVV